MVFHLEKLYLLSCKLYVETTDHFQAKFLLSGKRARVAVAGCGTKCMPGLAPSPLGPSLSSWILRLLLTAVTLNPTLGNILASSVVRISVDSMFWFYEIIAVFAKNYCILLIFWLGIIWTEWIIYNLKLKLLFCITDLTNISVTLQKKLWV